ncbi:hypothetical protein PsAD2_04638 [Pseudovibrio axinellae]|uniref:Helix-turn-helix domain protein n=1 Tax=Pseudovibrio axinellae TaxID=989403 RepID=A0A165SW47_9HYPH|nr:helix-turn-helix domain-containing protein [Pseudovibrio axinellae]KZL04555.1 hypothetical protein PsAD2_04638 [Pseudovibrio axinellae]SEQ73240.1 Helix-turn-helix domain-containing protein [Pseudovibrio axinellae]
MSKGHKAWSWRQAFSRSDLSPTTKHVLHTLALFMNEMGESCYPTIEHLMEHSSLSKNAVMKHLELAKGAGWITVSQHGFRGQKWKRRDYSARWPERDLDAPSLSERMVKSADEEEEGGARGGPPPLKKVVHEVGEGGARGGPKVVHEVDQDKNNPINNPIPIQERECAREIGNDKTTNSGKVSRETWVRRLKKVHERWPTRAGDSVEGAERLWFRLSDEERNQAEKLAKAYEKHIKDLGRTRICSLLTYLKEKRWKLLPKMAGGTGTGEAVANAAPFGKLWGVNRFSVLLAPPVSEADYPKPPAFIEERLRRGGEEAEKEKRDRRMIYGWRDVLDMQGKGVAKAKPVKVPKAMEPLGDEFEVVKVGSDVWRAWEQLHNERGWPWFGPDRDMPEWVWMPRLVSGEHLTPLEAVQDALESFEAAVRGLTETTNLEAAE